MGLRLRRDVSAANIVQGSLTSVTSRVFPAELSLFDTNTCSLPLALVLSLEPDQYVEGLPLCNY